MAALTKSVATLGLRTRGETPPGGPRRWVSALGLTVAGCCVLTLGACSSGSRADDPSDEPDARDTESSQTDPSSSPDPASPSASVEPGPSVPVPSAVRSEAAEAADDYLDTVGDVLEEPDPSSEETLPAVTGAALETLRNQIAEYDASGWKIVGEPVIVRQRVVTYSDDPPVAVVRACIDNSDVRVVDSTGKTVPGSTPVSPRTLNLFTLVKEKGAWAIAESRPAARPDC